MISIVRNTTEEILSYALGYEPDRPIEKNVQSEPESKKPKKKKPKKPAKKKTGLGRKFDLGLDKAAKQAKEINKPVKKKAKPKVQKQNANKMTRNNKGLKRKGRLPSKKIVNKLGNVQTVYYRPDKKSKSKYIDPTKLDTVELMRDYGDSFKRMLFRDHSKGSWWSRSKGQENQSWGSAMTKKLDDLADKYGFKEGKFEQQQESFVNERHGDLDGFLHDAQNIYGDLYKADGKHPFDFLNSVFTPTKNKIGRENVGNKFQNEIRDMGMGHMLKAIGEKNAKKGKLLGQKVAQQKIKNAKRKGAPMKRVATAAKPNKQAKPSAAKPSGANEDLPSQTELVANQNVAKDLNKFLKDFV